MHLVSLDVRTGQLIKRVAIADAVPGAASNFGYSETSAPICANGKVVIGAAGSEYGVRGFVMAYNTNLTPAWPNPFWTIPPEGTSWRRLSRIVGGGVVWTPQTIDPTTNTLYFGTGSATPLYFPQFRPGENPRTDSLIAVDLEHGTDEVVAAADGLEPVGLRHRAAAARLHGQGRREDAPRRLGRDDGGRLVRLRRRDRRPDLPADQGDRPHRAPAAPAGQARHGLPVLARRPQLLAGLVRPEDRLHPQRRRRDGVRAAAGEADADPEEAEARRGQRLPRARERQLRPVPARLARPRLDQRDRRQLRQARLEVHHARAGARRRDDDGERARLRGRRRRRPPRVRHEDGQGAVDVPDGASDRERPVALRGQRQGVPGDHRRRHAHLVGRRHGQRASGLRARRLLEAVSRAGAAREHAPPRGRADRRAADRAGRTSLEPAGAGRGAARAADRPRRRADRDADRARHPRLGRELVEHAERDRARPPRLDTGRRGADQRRRLRAACEDREGRQLRLSGRHHRAETARGHDRVGRPAPASRAAR